MSRYINADALIAQMRKIGMLDCIKDGVIFESFFGVPFEDIETKHGHWERHYSRPNVFADLYWHCSNCGFKSDNQFAYRYYHYCPNCGAKMDGEVTA